MLDAGEGCDDGCLEGLPNVCESVDDGDGCDSACQLEVVPEFSTITLLLAVLVVIGGVFAIRKRA